MPPRITGTDWQLQVAGLFDRPQSLTLRDLVAMPAVTQPITLSCISNPIGGDLISTGYWTGVRLKDLLAKLGLQPAAKELYIRAADGFYESVVMEDMMDPRVLLVYGMNGDTLPVEHGFPLRIYIPNRYGMKQPKWITHMEAISGSRQGYWVVRGWDAQARPKIISIIDTVARDHVQNGRVPVGGIAWAGDRGISKAEVQVDDGSWEEADLLTPPLGPLTWVLWRYDWPVAPGSHTFRGPGDRRDRRLASWRGKRALSERCNWISHCDDLLVASRSRTQYSPAILSISGPAKRLIVVRTKKQRV